MTAYDPIHEVRLADARNSMTYATENLAAARRYRARAICEAYVAGMPVAMILAALGTTSRSTLFHALRRGGVPLRGAAQ